jgi:hypothetical protein
VRALLCLLLAGCGGFHAIGDGGPDDLAGSPFTIVQELPDAGALNAVWGSGPNDVHAVGDDGLMFDWDGQQWNRVIGTTGVVFTGLWGAGATEIYAVGTYRGDFSGLIMRNAGNGWIEDLHVPTGLFAVWGDDAGTRYAIGDSGKIYKKTPSRTWYLLLTALPDPNLPPQPGTPQLWAMSGNGPAMALVAAGPDMTINFLGNSQWLPLYDPDTTRDFRSAWGPKSLDPLIYIGGNYSAAYLFLGKDQGNLVLHEERDTGDDKRFLWGVWGSSSDRVAWVGDGGRILTYDGGGNGLKDQPSPTRRSLQGIWFQSPDDVWIVGEAALIARGKLTY